MWQLNENFEEAEEHLGPKFSELNNYMLGGLPIVAISTFFAVGIGKSKWKLNCLHRASQFSETNVYINEKNSLGEINWLHLLLDNVPGFHTFNPHKNIWVHCDWKSLWELSNQGSNKFTLGRSFRLRFLALDLWANLINATFLPLWVLLYMSCSICVTLSCFSYGDFKLIKEYLDFSSYRIIQIQF